MNDKKIFQVKYVISGNVVEQYSYEKNRYKGFESNNIEGRSKNSLKSDEIRGQTLSKARQKVMRLINSNKDLNKFLTLTFEKNITDLDYSNDEFKKFIDRLNYKFINTKKRILKYVAVIEFQKRGAVHYHVICNLPYVDVKSLAEVWRHGFVRLNKINGDKDRFGSSECDNVGAYVCKYMTKDNTDTRLVGRKSYLVSRNLNKPIEVYVDINEKDLIKEVYGLPDGFEAYISKSSTITSAYYNEYTGSVIYNQYNLKRRNKQELKEELCVASS